MSFVSLGLAPDLAQAASALGFAEPTPIQREAIPAVLRGADLLATAPTGSGKTAAYALPVLQRLLQCAAPAGERLRRTRALVLVPTRELVTQVAALLGELARTLPQAPRVVVAVGGVSINPQLMALRGGAEVVVATPGRLLDVVRHNALRLDDVQQLVLDEADRLLDLGFAEELAEVLSLLPPQRQSLFFSATFPPAVQALARERLCDPLRVDLAPPTQPLAAIMQRAIAVDAARRAQLLRHLMQAEGWERVLVFVASQYAADHLARKLHQGDVFATSFHGGLSQGVRQQTLREFKERRWDVIVTTDLAARGLHIDQLPVVVNFDLPRSPVDHTHRIGRTGRAGASGLAISFVSAATLAQWRLIQKRLGLDLPLEQVPGFEPQEAAPAPGATAAPDGGGIKGKRPSKKDKLRAAAAADESALTRQDGKG
jgi:superfamily II DNA/RNA helicase